MPEVGQRHQLSAKPSTFTDVLLQAIMSTEATLTAIYVKQVDGVFRLANTRVSLDSLVYLFREGHSPESMVESYPVLSLEQVYGALAFYLANRAMIDQYLNEGEQAAELAYQRSNVENADLIAKLQRARLANQVPG
jgi:uncharacterized protein (DUF433 family)